MGTRLLLAGVALGALGDLLFHGHPLGANALLWALGFVAALALLIRAGRLPLHQGRRAMAAPLLLFAALLVWRDSPLLVAVNLLAIAGAVTIGALRRPAEASVGDVVSAAASAGSAAGAGAVRLLQRDVSWRELTTHVRRDRAATIARGIALGLPLLAVFGALFALADAVFQQLLESALPDVSSLWMHVLVASAFAWLAAGLLRDLVAARAEPTRAPRVLGSAEVAIALAAVNLLFLAFVLVQLRYLFGGRGLVEARMHLTYAEYARHGFFELVAVAVLVLPLLLAANLLVRGRARLVRLLSLGLVALVLVVMASALQRLRLYQQEFGLTELRLYATGVVLWLAAVFALLVVTVLRGRPRTFAFGAIMLGFAATFAFNALDPDALIVRTNLARPTVDVSYLTNLSDDAVPPLIARLPTLDPELRRPIAASLLARRTEHDLVGWNLSRERARRSLAAHHEELVRYSR
jgi:hypothetical protein